MCGLYAQEYFCTSQGRYQRSDKKCAKLELSDKDSLEELNLEVVTRQMGMRALIHFQDENEAHSLKHTTHGLLCLQELRWQNGLTTSRITSVPAMME